MVKHTEDSIKYLYTNSYKVKIPEITTHVKREAPGPHSTIRGLCIILSFYTCSNPCSPDRRHTEQWQCLEASPLPAPCIQTPPSHQPLETTDLYSVPVFLPFPNCCINGIIQYVSFQDRILKLSIVHLRFLYPWSFQTLKLGFLGACRCPALCSVNVCLACVKQLLRALMNKYGTVITDPLIIFNFHIRK